MVWVFFYYYYCFLRKGCLRVLVVVVGGCLRVFKRAAKPQVCSPRASCAAQEIGEAPRNPRGAGLPPRQSSPFSASSRGWVCVCFLKTRARPYTHTPPLRARCAPAPPLSASEGDKALLRGEKREKTPHRGLTGHRRLWRGVHRDRGKGGSRRKHPPTPPRQRAALPGRRLCSRVRF